MGSGRYDQGSVPETERESGFSLEVEHLLLLAGLDLELMLLEGVESETVFVLDTQ